MRSGADVYTLDVEAPQTLFTAELKALFVAAYEDTGEKKAAAAAVGMTRQTIYNHLGTDPEFAAACEAARGRLLAVCVGQLRKLAIDGVKKTTYDKDGKKVSETMIYSERMLLAWLKRLERDKWGDKIAVDQKVTVKEETKPQDIPPHAREKLREALAAIRRDTPSTN